MTPWPTLCLLLFASRPMGSPDVLPPLATAAYQVRNVRGFRVLVHPEVPGRGVEADALFVELDAQLEQVVRRLPAHAVEKLREVRFWVEWNRRPGGAAEYHVSAGWLRANNYNPEKARNVELNNARNFVAWSRNTQPFMVLHELAHAYHDRVYGYDDARIRAAYRQAIERKLYESVDFVHGGKRRAYALTSPQEYFAELTEAYFGKNDFFPFNRDQLEKHDPEGFRLVRDAWSEKPR